MKKNRLIEYLKTLFRTSSIMKFPTDATCEPSFGHLRTMTGEDNHHNAWVHRVMQLISDKSSSGICFSFTMLILVTRHKYQFSSLTTRNSDCIHGAYKSIEIAIRDWQTNISPFALLFLQMSLLQTPRKGIGNTGKQTPLCSPLRTH